MITRMDASIGSLIEKLDDPDGNGDKFDSVLNDTLVVFTSDNGPTPEDGSPIDFFDANGIYRGGKRDLYEGGIHVPAVAYWPGTIAAGSSTDYRTDLADFMATAADLAGVETPVGIDGVSIAPTLTGLGVQRQRKHLVFEHHEGSGPDGDSRAARWAIVAQDGKKLIRYSNNTYDLFDVAIDPSETSPLDLNIPANAQLASDLEAIAIAEGVQQGAVEFRTWSGTSSGAELNDGSNWIGGGVPTPFWSATVANTGSTQNVALASTSISTLGIEIRGDMTEQVIDVSPGRTLIGRNEVRISNGGHVSLASANLNSNRWIEIRGGGKLTGSGSVAGDVYNEGEIAPGREAALPSVEPPAPPPALPPADIDTGLVTAVEFDFTGIQDDAPLTQTSVLNEYASLHNGLDFGPGVLPRNAANAGDEFNVQGHVVGGTLQDAINSNDFLAFTISPVDGAGIIPESVSFDIWRNGGNAAEDWAVLSSVDGFTTSSVLGQISILTTGVENTQTLTGLFGGSDVITEPVEVRLYGWGANGGNGNTHINAVSMEATFLAAPSLRFDFTGVQDDAPLFATSIQDANLEVVGGLDFGPGVAPKNDGTNAGDEFNVLGFEEGSSLSQAIANENYLTFTIQAVPGLALIPEHVGFMLWRNGSNAPTDFALLSSIDGFANGAELSQAIFTDEGAANEHAFAGQFNNVSPTETIEFRLYGWNANAGGNVHITEASLRTAFASVVNETFGPVGE